MFFGCRYVFGITHLLALDKRQFSYNVHAFTFAFGPLKIAVTDALVEPLKHQESFSESTRPLARECIRSLDPTTLGRVFLSEVMEIKSGTPTDSRTQTPFKNKMIHHKILYVAAW